MNYYGGHDRFVIEQTDEFRLLELIHKLNLMHDTTKTSAKAACPEANQYAVSIQILDNFGCVLGKS